MTPGGVISPEGRLTIKLLKEKTPAFGFGITFHVKQQNTIQVDMKAMCEKGGELREFKLSDLQAASNMADMMQAAAAGGGGGGKKKQHAVPPNPQQQQTVKAIREQVAALNALAGELTGKKINYRIFVACGKADDPAAGGVTLFQAGEPPKPAPAKPDRKGANRKDK